VFYTFGRFNPGGRKMTTAQQRLNRAAAEQTAATVAAKRERTEYFITDPNMKNIGNVRLKPGQTSVILTADEAKAFLGQGLDTVSPQERAKQAEAIEAADKEHREKHAEHEAKRIEAAERNAKKAAGSPGEGKDGGGASEPSKDPAPTAPAVGEAPAGTLASRRARA
jgi:hypothetical protein